LVPKLIFILDTTLVVTLRFLYDRLNAVVKCKILFQSIFRLLSIQICYIQNVLEAIVYQQSKYQANGFKGVKHTDIFYIRFFLYVSFYYYFELGFTFKIKHKTFKNAKFTI